MDYNSVVSDLESLNLASYWIIVMTMVFFFSTEFMGNFNSAISDNWSDALVELILHLLGLKDVIKMYTAPFAAKF